MKATFVSYSDTHSFSKLSLDYLADEPTLRPFYAFKPDLSGIHEAIIKREFEGNRATLREVIEKQYALIETTDLVKSNIVKLGLSNTYTITTGHQLNIFTGPLYFVYKIVSAINLAKQLNLAYPELNFVPIYWMASEDHDFSEINHVNLSHTKLSWHQDYTGATGKIPTASITSTLQEFQAYLGLDQYAGEISNWMHEAYTLHPILADATRYFVNKLFQKYGLVILDPDDTQLKSIFKPILKAELSLQNSETLVQATSKKLEDLGYKPQIYPRPINLFYLLDGLRERIELKDGNYLVQHTDISFSQAEMQAEVSNHPERFSPNVVLRPVYQEAILPNIAYIGGAAELAYWMQLKDVFENYKIDFPVILLRNSALLLEARAESLLAKLGFSDTDIFLKEEILIDKWLAKHAHQSTSLIEEKQTIKEVVENIKHQAIEIDTTLAYSSEAALVRILKIVDQFEHKIYKAQKKKHHASLRQIETLKDILYPNNQIQERYLNIVPFYAKYGSELIAHLMETLNPLDNQFTLIHLPE